MKNRSTNIILLIVLCVFTFIVNNTAISTDIMESRNIVTAREMVYDGNWLVPTMNGELRFEKPVLPTWIAAVAEIISPDNLGLQRAMAGAAATMLVIFFFLLGNILSGNREYAFVSSLVLCTSYSIILMGRTATWDIYCHAFMMGAIYFIFKALMSESRRYIDFVFAGLMMGLSFLSKGPTSFYSLLLPFIFCLIIFRKGSVKGKIAPLIICIIICAVLSGGWYVYLYTMHNAEVQQVIHKESSAWVEYHTRPWWYYYKFYFETGIWALLLLTALFFPYWKNKSRYSKENYLFPLLWMIISLVLLSIVPEKKNRYLLPILVPASYMIGYVFTYWKKSAAESSMKRTDKLIYIVNTSIIAIVILAIPVATYLFLYSKGDMSLSVFILITAFILFLAIYLMRAVLYIKPYRFLYGIVGLFIFAEIAVLPYAGKIVKYEDNNGLSAIRNIPELNGIQLYYNDTDIAPRIEIIYDAYRKIRPLSFKDTVSIFPTLPCAVLTHGDLSEEMPQIVLERLDTLHIGRFDNNRWRKDSKNYSNEFVYNVTLLRKRK